MEAWLLNVGFGLKVTALVFFRESATRDRKRRIIEKGMKTTPTDPEKPEGSSQNCPWRSYRVKTKCKYSQCWWHGVMWRIHSRLLWTVTFISLYSYPWQLCKIHYTLHKIYQEICLMPSLPPSSKAFLIYARWSKSLLAQFRRSLTICYYFSSRIFLGLALHRLHKPSTLYVMRL